VKTFSVSAFFPELRPAHLAEQRIVVQASSLRSALSRAFGLIRNREGIKGKTIRIAKVTIAETPARREAEQ
jgi:hypothetical protein